MKQSSSNTNLKNSIKDIKNEIDKKFFTVKKQNEKDFSDLKNKKIEQFKNNLNKEGNKMRSLYENLKKKISNEAKKYKLEFSKKIDEEKKNIGNFIEEKSEYFYKQENVFRTIFIEKTNTLVEYFENIINKFKEEVENRVVFLFEETARENLNDIKKIKIGMEEISIKNKEMDQALISHIRKMEKEEEDRNTQFEGTKTNIETIAADEIEEIKKESSKKIKEIKESSNKNYEYLTFVERKVDKIDLKLKSFSYDTNSNMPDFLNNFLEYEKYLQKIINQLRVNGKNNEEIFNVLIKSGNPISLVSHFLKNENMLNEKKYN